ncbi:MAG: type II secretion system F family protein [Candidatus Aminicenantes bacterium]|nr:type II secretion system F family protein [Candidatus Aminicenantes bacterium]
MPYFLCRLAAEDGRVFTESFLSTSQDECRRHFESEGFCVLSIQKDWKKQRLSSLSFEKKVKDRDFIMFNQELMALVRAGYPVLRSIEVISNRVKNPYLKEVLRKVEIDIRHGKALSESFAPFEKRFSKIYTAALMAGEQSGNLPDTVGQFIQYAKVIAQTKRRIRSALTYPILLLIFSSALLGILINFVLPNFSEFYKDFEAQLPIITALLMSFSVFVRGHWPLWIALAALLVLAYVQLKKNEKTLFWLEKMKLKIPLGRVIWTESAISLFSRTLSLLLQAGIPLLTGVGLACQAIPNKYLASRTAILPGSIKNGESLSESLAKTEFFPPLSLDMIRIGETSANLGEMLKEVADVYDESIQAKIDTFVSLIEPVVIIFMGLLVAVMLLSVYLPIFNIIKVAR